MMKIIDNEVKKYIFINFSLNLCFSSKRFSPNGGPLGAPFREGPGLKSRQTQCCYRAGVARLFCSRAKFKRQKLPRAAHKKLFSFLTQKRYLFKVRNCDEEFASEAAKKCFAGHSLAMSVIEPLKNIFLRKYQIVPGPVSPLMRPQNQG